MRSAYVTLVNPDQLLSRPLQRGNRLSRSGEKRQDQGRDVGQVGKPRMKT